MDLRRDLFLWKISTVPLPTGAVEFWGLVAVLRVVITDGSRGSSSAGWHRQHQEHRQILGIFFCISRMFPTGTGKRKQPLPSEV